MNSRIQRLQPGRTALTLLLGGLLLTGVTLARQASAEETASEDAAGEATPGAQSGSVELSADSPDRDVESGVIYRWIDKNGQVQYTDFQPIGVPSEEFRLEPDEDQAAGISIEPAGQSRKSDPFHDQDQQILPIEHIGPCANARQQLAVLRGTQPVYRAADGSYRSAWRGDPYRGERDYLDDEARQAAAASANREVLTRCSDPEAFKAEQRAFRESLGAGAVKPDAASAPPGKSSD